MYARKQYGVWLGQRTNGPGVIYIIGLGAGGGWGVSASDILGPVGEKQHGVRR